MNNIISVAKRVICIFLLLSCFISCVYANNEISYVDLQHFMEETLSYFVSLDVKHDPVLVLDMGGKYSLKAKNGSVIVLLEKNRHQITLSLDIPENMQRAESILNDASDILQAIQTCLQNGFYTDLYTNPTDVIQNTIYIELTDEGIGLFPESDNIEYIKVHISTHTTNKIIDNSVQIQKQRLVPDGISICIKRQNNDYEETYCYGANYDYTLEG